MVLPCDNLNVLSFWFIANLSILCEVGQHCPACLTLAVKWFLLWPNSLHWRQFEVKNTELGLRYIFSAFVLFLFHMLGFDWLVWNDLTSPVCCKGYASLPANSETWFCITNTATLSSPCFFFPLSTPTEPLHLSALCKMKMGPESRYNRVWNYIFKILWKQP